MSDHLADQEQLENLKRWWKENGVQTVLIVALAVGGWFGWQFWQETRKTRAEQASFVYTQLLDAQAEDGVYTAEERARLVRLAVTLKDTYSGSLYGPYAALILAKLAVDENDLEGAARELQWVLDHAREPGLEMLTKLRLARVESARGHYQQALDLLNVNNPGALASAFSEARGDTLLSLGQNAEARSAYEMALATLPPDDYAARSLLELKLGHVPIADDPAREESGGDA